MIFRITFKDPDGVSYGIDEAAEQSIGNNFVDEDEAQAVYEIRKEKIKEQLEKWIEYSEYITIEFDTEKKTATVIENK